MKVILYMAVTVNGFIAKQNDDTSFVSKTEWKSFRKIVKKTGNIVIGRRTYEVMKSSREFDNLKGTKVIVVTAKKIIDPEISIERARSPKDAINILRKHKFSTAIVAGGGTLNGSFMKEGLIDEMYLDVEPLAIGNGVRLFGDVNFEGSLKLINTKKLSRNEIQLHYAVKKNGRKQR